MVPRTSIEWSYVSWKPTTGCTKASAGCDIYYARRLATVRRSMHYRAKEPVVDTLANRQDPLAVRTWRDRSVSDLFHTDIAEELLRETVEAILAADRHVYQVMTKRPSPRRPTDARSRAGSGPSSRARSIGSGLGGENE